MKVIRVRAVAAESLCTGCLGCEAMPDDQDCYENNYDLTANATLHTDYIYIKDTPKGRAEYAALVLEHGLLPDKSV